MWYLKNIPRVAYFYWGGGKLSYLRYLTLATFRKLNPEWQIVLYVPETSDGKMPWLTTEHKYNQGYDDWAEDAKYLGADIRTFPFYEASFIKNASDVHRADWLRWHLLHFYGGLWSDMDILYIKSMDDLYFNTEDNGDMDMIVCDRVYGHSIGFLAGQRFNSYYGELARSTEKNYVSGDYQCIGSKLFNKLFPNELHKAINIEMDVVYPYDANHCKAIFEPQTAPLGANTIGIHWYAGSKYAGEFLNRTNGGFSPDNSLIGQYIRNAQN